MNSKNQIPLWGIFFMLAGVFMMAIMDGFTKFVATRYSYPQILFFESVFSFIPLYFYLRHKNMLNQLRTKRKMLNFLRSAASIGTAFCYIYALGHMPFATLYTIEFSSPFFIVLLSLIILRESIPLRSWIALIVGFIGVVIAVDPVKSGFEVAEAIGLLGAFLYALSGVQVRLLSATDNPGAIVFSFLVLSTLFSGFLLPFYWSCPDFNDFLCLAAIGLAGGIGQIFYTKAFSQQNLSVIAPFAYTGIIWAVLIGWGFWGEVPDEKVWIGATIIIISGIVITMQEHKFRRVGC